MTADPSPEPAPPSRLSNHFLFVRGLLRYRARVLVLAVSLLLAALGALLLRSPDMAEQLCAGGPTARVAIRLSHASAALPTSVMELLIAAIIVTSLVKLVRGIVTVARGKARLPHAAAAGALWVAALLAFILASFFPLFGVAYARRPLAERLGWSAETRAPTGTAQELERIALEMVLETNLAYERVAGSQDLGRPTEPPSPEALDLALERAYGRIADRFGLDPSIGEARGPAKRFIITRAFSSLGIGGVYCPWTGEANVNAEEPWCDRAFTMAHEKAHQRLFASEDEANFVGFLACALSDDPYAHYAGALFAQRRLVIELQGVSLARAEPLLARRHRGVQRDVNDLIEFVRSHESPVTHAAHAVNHVYLQANGVVEGAASYGLSSRLLVGLARTRGGSLAGLRGGGR